MADKHILMCDITIELDSVPCDKAYLEDWVTNVLPCVKTQLAASLKQFLIKDNIKAKIHVNRADIWKVKP